MWRQSNNGDLSKVQYTLKNATAEPSVFRNSLRRFCPSAYVIEEGNGDPSTMVTTCLLRLPCSTAPTASSTVPLYSSEPILLPVNDQLKKAAPQVYETLKKMKVGGSFSYTTNVLQQRSTAGVTTTTASPGTATNVEVYTVKTKLPKYATGKAVEADPSLRPSLWMSPPARLTSSCLTPSRNTLNWSPEPSLRARALKSRKPIPSTCATLA